MGSNSFAHDTGVPAIRDCQAKMGDDGRPSKITLDVGVPDGASYDTYTILYKVVGGVATPSTVERAADGKHYLDHQTKALARGEWYLKQWETLEGVDSLAEVQESAITQGHVGYSLHCTECDEKYPGIEAAEQEGGPSLSSFCPNCGAANNHVAPEYQVQHNRGEE